MTTDPIPTKKAIINGLKANGRTAELEHPNASLYWNGTSDDIRYVCRQCANWYTTPEGLNDHNCGRP
jgi:hypothetical protein